MFKNLWIRVHNSTTDNSINTIETFLFTAMCWYDACVYVMYCNILRISFTVLCLSVNHSTPKHNNYVCVQLKWFLAFFIDVFLFEWLAFYVYFIYSLISHFFNIDAKNNVYVEWVTTQFAQRILIFFFKYKDFVFPFSRFLPIFWSVSVFFDITVSCWKISY